MNSTRNVEEANLIAWAIFILFFLYSLFGAFPFAHIESDGDSIANGITQMSGGFQGEPPLSYRFDFQQGTYYLTYFFSNIFDLEPFFAFNLLSLIFGIGFVLFAMFSISGLTGLAAPVCGLVLLLFQETSAGYYYANSNVFAGFFALAAIFIITRFPQSVKSFLAAGFFLALAVWARIDTILITPVVGGVAIYYNTLKEGAKFVFFSAGSCVVSLLAIFYIFNVSIERIVAKISLHVEMTGVDFIKIYGIEIPYRASEIKAYLSLFSFLILYLFVMGLMCLIKDRKWRLLFVILLSLMPFFVIFTGNITTPKYFYAYIPLISIPVCYFVLNLRSGQIKFFKLHVTLVMALFLVQYVIGLSIYLPSKPYVRETYPKIMSIYQFNKDIGPVSSVKLVLGSGTVITTDDGVRASSGILFHPLMWHEKNKNLYEAHNDLQNLISNIDFNISRFLVTHGISAPNLFHALLINNWKYAGKENININDAAGTLYSFSTGQKAIDVTIFKVPNIQRGIPDLSSGFSSMNKSGYIFFNSLGSHCTVFKNEIGDDRLGVLVEYMDIWGLCVYNVTNESTY